MVFYGIDVGGSEDRRIYGIAVGGIVQIYGIEVGGIS